MFLEKSEPVLGLYCSKFIESLFPEDIEVRLFVLWRRYEFRIETKIGAGEFGKASVVISEAQNRAVEARFEVEVKV